MNQIGCELSHLRFHEDGAVPKAGPSSEFCLTDVSAKGCSKKPGMVITGERLPCSCSGLALSNDATCHLACPSRARHSTLTKCTIELRPHTANCDLHKVYLVYPQYTNLKLAEQ